MWFTRIKSRQESVQHQSYAGYSPHKKMHLLSTQRKYNALLFSDWQIKNWTRLLAYLHICYQPSKPDVRLQQLWTIRLSWAGIYLCPVSRIYMHTDCDYRCQLVSGWTVLLYLCFLRVIIKQCSRLVGLLAVDMFTLSNNNTSRIVIVGVVFFKGKANFIFA